MEQVLDGADAVRFYICRAFILSNMLQQTWFAIGHFFNSSFSILRAMGWLPDVAFILVLAFGAGYWLMWQARYNRRAKEKGESI